MLIQANFTEFKREHPLEQLIVEADAAVLRTLDLDT